MMDLTWQQAAQAMRAEGLSYSEIGRRLGMNREPVQRALDPTFAARIRARQTGWRASRSTLPSTDGIVPTEKTVVRERCDGSRISLPRVRWLERPMPATLEVPR